MKALSILLLICFVSSANAMTPKQCVEGAVWEVDEWGDPVLADCAKWESDNPEARVAEQEAIDKAYNTPENVEVIQPEDPTPVLGKAQNKLNELGHELFNAIGLN